ncbi:MAG: LamG domain-containing protein [Candidatus Limnocylindria bacterium]
MGPTRPIAPTTAPAQSGGSTLRRKLLASVAVLGALAVVGGFGTFSAFTAMTSNSGNSFDSGTVKIDQHAGHSSLYVAADKKPGEATTGCVRVTYSGSLAAAVRLYFSAGITNGAAFNLNVERGSGLMSPGAAMSCTGFAASSTVYDAALGSFPASWTVGNAAKPGGGAWAQNEAADYRFTITANDDNTPNAHTSAQATGTHSFTWEARGFDPYPATILQTPGLLSYWRLGDTTGTTAYDTTPAGGANGTYENGVVLGRPSLITGDSDTSAGFDGANDHVDFGDRYDFAGIAPFTVETWITPSSVNESLYRRLFSKEVGVGGTRQGWDMLIHSTSSGSSWRVVLERWNSTRVGNVVSTTALAAGQRYQLVGTYDGTTMQIYVNGVAEASSASAAVIPDTSAPLRLGAHSSGGAHRFAGDMDDVAAYDRALSAVEVKQHYDRGNGS